MMYEAGLAGPGNSLLMPRRRANALGRLGVMHMSFGLKAAVVTALSLFLAAPAVAAVVSGTPVLKPDEVVVAYSGRGVGGTTNNLFPSYSPIFLGRFRSTVDTVTELGAFLNIATGNKSNQRYDLQFSLFSDTNGIPDLASAILSENMGIRIASPTLLTSYYYGIDALNQSVRIGAYYWMGLGVLPNSADINPISISVGPFIDGPDLVPFDKFQQTQDCLTTVMGLDCRGTPVLYPVRDSGILPFRVAGTTIGSPSAVPEPAVWAMLIAGFAMIGAALRRRRTVSLRLRAA